MVQKTFHGFPAPVQFPEGGTTGQLLRKVSSTPFHMDWASAVPGSGDMLAEAYDPDDIGLDVFGGGIRLPTRAAIPNVPVPLIVEYIVTFGYAVVGDGGAGLYKRVDTEPSHAGKVQSQDDAWWELVKQHPCPEQFGAVGDGTTDDAAAIQAAVDYVGTGIVYLSREYATTAPIELNDGSALVADGTIYTTGGKRILYSGTAQAVRAKNAFADTDNSRSICLKGIEIHITGAGAIGLLVQAAKGWDIDDVTIRLQGSSAQTGMHMWGERTGRTFAGNFYNLIKKLRIIGNDKTNGHVGIILSGEYNNGQNNSNTFIEIGMETLDKGWIIGPSLTNRVFGFSVENIQTVGMEFLADASRNAFYGGHFETMPLAVSFASGASNNKVLDNLFAASVTQIVSDASANYVEHAGVIYSGGANQSQRFRLPTDTNNRLALGNAGVFFGNGTDSPTTAGSTGRRLTRAEWLINEEQITTSGATYTPDRGAARGHYVRLESGAGGTTTIAAPTNSFSEGQWLDIEIINNSGGTRTLAWNAAFIKNANLPTSIANGVRLTVQFRRRATSWVLFPQNG